MVTLIRYMLYHKVLLSGGSFPWFGINQYFKFIKEIGYDGLEILPTRRVVSSMNNSTVLKNPLAVHSIHQSWRLDNPLDKKYGISFLTSFLLKGIGYIFFPPVEKSNHVIDLLILKNKIPIVVHDISSEWTMNSKNEIQLEIFKNIIKKGKLKDWLKIDNHAVVIDTRDDQSLAWAKKNGFEDWKEFWKWIGLEKIKSVQLTFIGTGGIRKILKHNYILAQDQLIFLYQNNWSGSVVIEVNPISLLLNGVSIKKGFEVIKQFVETTLGKGQEWS